MKTSFLTFFIALLINLSGSAQESDNQQKIICYELDPQKQEIQFFWKSENGKVFKNIETLKKNLESKGLKLVFAMNGGMFLKDYSPQGLYIENRKLLSKLNTIKDGYGNFYMQPNGVFYLDGVNEPKVCRTKDFKYNENIKFATQSGPMLVVDGKIHSKFTMGSKNKHIRNGVGVLPNGNLLFAMSKEKINFYDFATFFKSKGCKNALYLDGFVSRTYLPSKNWEQTDGTYAIIIAELER